MEKKKINIIKKPASLLENIGKKPVIPQQKRTFDMRPNLSKMYLYITIVNEGVGKHIVKLMEGLGSSCSFVNVGTGTASEQVLKALNVSNNQKEIVFSFVRETRLPEISEEISAFFLAQKKNKGIGFAIPLTTVMGVRVYKFLSQTI